MKKQLATNIIIFLMFINAIAAVCPVTKKINNLHVIATLTNPPAVNPISTLTEAQCETACNKPGVMAWTRYKPSSINNCYCVKQPFGSGGIVSAYSDNNWSSGFYPNGPVVNGCPSVQIGAQILFSNVILSYGTSSANDCAFICRNWFSIEIWTWTYPSGNDENCYCLGEEFGPNAIEYDPTWTFGFSKNLIRY